MLNESVAIYITINMLALLSCLQRIGALGKGLIISIAATFILTREYKADTLHYNEAFVSGGYFGGDYEYGWRFIQNCIKTFSDPEYTMACIQVFIILLLAFLTRNSPAMPLATISNSSIMIAMNGLRQGIASALIYQATRTKSLLNTIIWLSLSATVHTSTALFSAVLIPSILIGRIEQSRSRLAASLIFITITLSAAIFAPSLDFDLLGYQAYFRSDEGETGRIHGIVKYVGCSADVILYIILKHYLAPEEARTAREYSLRLFMITILGSGIALSMAFGAHDILARCYFMISTIITLSLINSCKYNTDGGVDKRNKIMIIIIATRNLLAINAIKILML